MPEAHSKYSASNYEADALCPGRPVLSVGLPDRGSVYADEGTAAHELLTRAMQECKPAKAFKGTRFVVGTRTFEVDDDMIGAVQTAIDNITDIAGGGAILLDRRVNYSKAIGTEHDEAWGTLDVISLRGTELQIHDYKHGRGVEVDAGSDEDGPNMQMALYALGALAECDDVLGPFATVRLVIHQPRVKSAPSEYVMSVALLYEWARLIAKPAVTCRASAEQTYKPGCAEWEKTFLRPNEKSCKFCKAKATCPALRKSAIEQVFASSAATPEDFDDLTVPAKPHVQASTDDWLAAAMSKADLIEDWLKAVRAEVEARLLEGKPIAGWKLVQGKRGNRRWIDNDAAVAALQALDVPLQTIYTQSLNSPASIEKAITKEQFIALNDQITQADGSPHVAPASDKRPPITIKSVADEFDNLNQETP